MTPRLPSPWESFTRPDDPGVEDEHRCFDRDHALIVIFSLSCVLQAALVALALWVLR